MITSRKEGPPAPASAALPPELARLADEFRAARAAAAAVTRGLDAEQLRWRPADGAWSIVECLQHLVHSGRLYLPEFDRVLAEAPAAAPNDRRAYAPSLKGRLLAWSVEPPYRFRTKTFQPLEPLDAALDPLAVPSAFAALQSELIERVAAARGRDLRRTRLASVLAPRLVLGVVDWFRFLAAHQRRHLWQAERVRRSPRWPDRLQQS